MPKESKHKKTKTAKPKADAAGDVSQKGIGIPQEPQQSSAPDQRNGWVVPIVVALIGLAGIIAPILLSKYFSTLPSTPTATVESLPSPTLSPTPYICPYQGETDDETIENLIRAEATAVNNKDFAIILKIFSPDAEFYDYAQEDPKTWQGPHARYQNDLFQNTEFQGVQHVQIMSVGSGNDGNVAYYVSGSIGSYRSGNGDWETFNNPSIPSTQYGSDHWVLQKDKNGCWVIVRMEFNAGHKEFPP